MSADLMTQKISHVVFLLAGLATVASGAVFHAADYGAHPDDAVDDTAALRSLFAEAQKISNAEVHLEKGQYDLVLPNAEKMDAQPTIFEIRKAHGLRIAGSNSHLIVNGVCGGFRFDGCSELKVSGLTLDWEPKPHLSVRVVEVNDEFVLVEPLSGMAMTDLPLQGWLPWDAERHRPAPGTDERYWLLEEGPTLEKLPDGRFKIPLFPKTGARALATMRLQAGDYAALRFRIYSRNALTFVGCNGVQVHDLTIFSAPGMGLSFRACADVEVSQLQIRPASAEDFLSTCADGIHVVNGRGRFEMRDVTLRAMGDDGLNVAGILMQVASVSSPRDLRLISGNGRTPLPDVPQAGDAIELAPAGRPLEFQPVGKVVHAQMHEKKWEVTLDSDLPDWAGPGATFANLSAQPEVTVTRLKVRNNRARGMVFSSAGAIAVSESEVIDNSGSAVLLSCDVRHWWEGPGIRSFRMTNCVLKPGNDGRGSGPACVVVRADAPKGEVETLVHHNLVFANNQIGNGVVPAISIYAASNVRLENNKLLPLASRESP